MKFLLMESTPPFAAASGSIAPHFRELTSPILHARQSLLVMQNASTETTLNEDQKVKAKHLSK